MIINVYKQLGKTPLETINILKQKYPQYADIKMGYAGRLDPLAEGVLLVLGGEETLKRQKEYMELDKEYEAEILFGIETDTYDVLGIPSFVNSFAVKGVSSPPPQRRPRNTLTAPLRAIGRVFRCPISNPLAGRAGMVPSAGGGARPRGSAKSSLGILTRVRNRSTWKLCHILKEFKGEYTFTLPPYSSYRIGGKPLFWWARNGKLDEIEIPEKTVKIYKIKLIDVYDMDAEELGELVNERVDMVKGDFRQEEIKKSWMNACSSVEKDQCFFVAKIKVKCSRGTYIRSIADDLGKRLGTGAVLVGLKRTRVGRYKIKDSIRLE